MRIFARNTVYWTVLALLSVSLVLSACTMPATPADTGTGTDAGAATPATGTGGTGTDAGTATPATGTDTGVVTDTEELTDTEDMTDTEGVTDTEGATGTTGMGDTGTGMAGTINIGQSADYGEVLTDAEGRTYYTFGGDAEPSDLGDFERVEAGDADTVGEGLDEAELGTVDVDGISQLTYRGRPLFRFSGDVNPGDVLGQGVNDEWWALDAQGEPIEE